MRIIDSPSKKLLNITTNITPKNCPPNNRIPPAVASPTGNVVWVAKSVAVVRRG